MTEFSDLIAIALVCTKIVLIGVSVIFLLSGLDDLFIDACYLLRALWRKVVVTPRYSPLAEQQLLDKPEQPVAIMLPAWDESAVIRPMLMNTLRTLAYGNYHVFVGTYPNDKDTQREVDEVCAISDRVHKVVTADPGPTCKADCLNWIYSGIRNYERESGIEFQIFVMQDCEDVIHPLCYRIFNWLIPRKDMVQLPVLSLARKWYEFTASHYIDEFAQLHNKDMVVREAINRSVPAAGVGVAFSRRALQTAAKENNGQVFSVNSLTEDYDFGFRLKEYGLKQVFVRFWTTRTVRRKHWLTRRERDVSVPDLVCIREYFPSDFHASIRQKSRWVVGIALQGWEHLGWHGGLANCYMLYRDRKALLTNLVNLIGYVIALAIIGLAVWNWLDPEAYRYPSLIEPGGMLWYLMIANGVLFGVRIALRVWCTTRFYDPVQGLLSVPRMVWGNLINFFATARAIKLYVRYLRTGKKIGWDKTQHVYPSDEELSTQRRRIGELLIERRMINPQQLAQALADQQRSQERLGEVLKRMGYVGENQLAQALSAQ